MSSGETIRPDGLGHWFPVAFARDVEPGRVDSVEVLHQRAALFRDASGAVAALVDRCPHRGARLSDGRVHSGTVECLYHGWRFDGSGECVEAPQQPADRPLPEGSCARPIPVKEEQGLVWLWFGPGSGAEHERPTVKALDAPGVRSVDFTIDLPYGQDYFVENVLDVAHIHVAHAGTRGGGDRRLAGPLEFDVGPSTAAGFEARFRSLEVDAQRKTAGLVGAKVRFLAPNLVQYESEFSDPDKVSGLALYSIPLSAGRSRMLYRAYGNLWTADDLARPRWREHLDQCFLLEEDMAVVEGQAREIDASGEPLAEMWNPLRTSDRLVVRYREWVEQFVPDRPGAVGFRSVGQRGVLEPAQPRDRWTLHTRHCSDCRTELARARERRQRWAVAAGLGVVGTALVAGSLGWLPGLAAAGVSIGCALLAIREHDRAHSFIMQRDLG